MKKKPWTEEIALCDFLVGYLEKLLPAEEDTISPAALEAASSTGVVHEGFEDLKLATRKKEIVDDFMVMGGGKPKKNKKKVKKKDDRLTHSVDFLSSFELLSLEAPMKVTDIPASIEQLNEKRAYYDVLPRAPKKGITESDEIEGSDVSNKKKPKVQKKKKASAPSVESSDLFPTLPGSKSPKTVPAAATNGPTAVDMVNPMEQQPKKVKKKDDRLTHRYIHLSILPTFTCYSYCNQLQFIFRNYHKFSIILSIRTNSYALVVQPCGTKLSQFCFLYRIIQEQRKPFLYVKRYLLLEQIKLTIVCYQNASVYPQLDFLSSFELLSLEAPMKVTDIPASIEQLNEKRAYYDVLPRAPKKGITESDEIEGSDVSNKKKPKVQKKKKASAPSVESSDLFPTLPGSKSPKTVPAAATNGPTAVDMVKSNGTATLNNGQIPPSSPTPAESLAMPTSSPVYSAE
eukprot:CAMPEP_0204894614 /NCGR_PEP_ID=MMETSP1349-20130617/33520_1 /ASSEMBLY_ACC=CAM_ASM_000710 /TAXON_ID=215587 /ORGANISM="Aplanochytrium stocchinoi, Strain GSBS06" /LENGTH=457 /DNA_ID=CAMNT_0052061801 /DNA_START=81 /DNA_END=1457 /DNA_ORIENTATION=+